MKWIIGLVVIAALGWFGFQYMNNNAATDVQNAATQATATETAVDTQNVASQATEAAVDTQNVAAQATAKAGEAAASARASATEALATAQQSMPAGINLSKITDSLDGILSSSGDALGSITDIESAEAALPALEDTSSRLSGIGNTISRLPSAAKGPIAGIVSGGLSTLRPLVENATAIPGVGDIINPVVTPMLENLQGLAD